MSLFQSPKIKHNDGLDKFIIHHLAMPLDELTGVSQRPSFQRLPWVNNSLKPVFFVVSLNHMSLGSIAYSKGLSTFLSNCFIHKNYLTS